MKRKIFTSLAAAGLLACTIVTASAAERTQSPRWFCFYWKNPCFEIQAPVLPDDNQQPSIVPDTPDTEQTPSIPETPEQNSSMQQIEKDAAALVNQMRTQNGLQPLKIDGNLSVKARIKSNDMKVNNYFSHNSPTYGTPFQMMQSLGIAYQSAGENIAKGYTSAEAVVNAWMNSASHRANILSSNYTTIGIGYVDGYWTQWFIG